MGDMFFGRMLLFLESVFYLDSRFERCTGGGTARSGEQGRRHVFLERLLVADSDAYSACLRMSFMTGDIARQALDSLGCPFDWRLSGEADSEIENGSWNGEADEPAD